MKLPSFSSLTLYPHPTLTSKALTLSPQPAGARNLDQNQQDTQKHLSFLFTQQTLSWISVRACVAWNGLECSGMG
ncbi:hypothetical protein E2C01_096689 [Portunus trituberculatus]|uniref:Uncharacterized protein n=1 Tax=Portunus trituberculatus TaxID=210409 RepID=A0A5B7JW97_PORTR|nr:hypothetical protein [Portunus trituberculatus]